MGVPITFIDKFSPDEFQILGCSYSYGDPGEPYHIKEKGFNVSVNGKNIYKRIFIRIYIRLSVRMIQDIKIKEVIIK